MQVLCIVDSERVVPEDRNKNNNYVCLEDQLFHDALPMLR